MQNNGIRWRIRRRSAICYRNNCAMPYHHSAVRMYLQDSSTTAQESYASHLQSIQFSSYREPFNENDPVDLRVICVGMYAAGYRTLLVRRKRGGDYFLQHFNNYQSIHLRCYQSKVPCCLRQILLRHKILEFLNFMGVTAVK